MLSSFSPPVTLRCPVKLASPVSLSYSMWSASSVRSPWVTTALPSRTKTLPFIEQVSASSRTGSPFSAAAIGAASGYCVAPGASGAPGSASGSPAGASAAPAAVSITHLPPVAAVLAAAPVSERGAALVTSCAARCVKLATPTVILMKKKTPLSAFARLNRPSTCRARTTL